MIIYYFAIFIGCIVAIYVAGELIVSSLGRIAKFLGWKEFVVAFFIMAVAGSLPNLFLGIISALNGVPELSFGDVVGGNVVDLTLTIALAALFAKEGIPARSKVIQTSSLFTIGAALLPLFLFADGTLSRGDGIVLLAYFFAYMYWLFSEKVHFKKVYNNYAVPKKDRFRAYIFDLAKVFGGALILIGLAQGIVYSAQHFAVDFNMPLPLVGILVVGLGNCFPELYFSVVSARKGENRMILGDLLGSIIIPSTLVLGVVCLMKPIIVTDVTMFALARYFLVVAAVFFFVFVRTDKRITKREAMVLLLIYIVFLIAEIFAK